MLVLSRRRNEALYIGDAVKITVLSVQGNRVRIAIEAPSDVEIDRSEVRQRKAASSVRKCFTSIQEGVAFRANDAILNTGQC